MPDQEQPQSPKPQPTLPAGDTVDTVVGSNAQKVAAGKNIVQIIVDRLDLPPWLLVTLAACFVVVAVVALSFFIRLLWGGLPVVVLPGPPAESAQQAAAAACPGDRPCVLVADFDPADQELAREMTRKIRSALASEDLLPPETFAVRPVGVVNDAAAAHQLAEQERALIVVWGQVLESLHELTISFALTDQLGIAESRQLRPYRVEFFDAIAQKMTCFDACFEEPAIARATLDQISTIVAYTAAGMLHYANDQPEIADRDFLAALFCSGQTGEGQPQPAQQLKCDPNLPMSDFNPATIYYYAGKAKVLTGDYAKAVDFLLQAGQLNDDDPASWLGVASAYASWLNNDDAAFVTDALAEARKRTENLQRELENRPDSQQKLAAVDYESGFIAELEREWASAQVHYQAAVTKIGANAAEAYVPLVALGRVERLGGQTDAAATTLQDAIALDASAPWAYLELAQVYRNDRPAAEDQLELARNVAPNQAYVDIIQAELCASEAWGDYDCAVAAYGRALEKRPDSGWLHSRVADFYRLNEPNLPQPASRQQAADHYAQAVELRPNDPWAHTRLAYMYYVLGDYAAAVAHYETALTLVYDDQNAAAIYCPLAGSQEAAGQIDAARVSYEACATQGTDDERNWANSQLQRLGK